MGTGKVFFEIYREYGKGPQNSTALNCTIAFASKSRYYLPERDIQEDFSFQRSLCDSL